MGLKLYTCIIFFEDKNKTPYKFRNVNINGIKKLITYGNKHQVKYFNVYDKATKKFIERVYINANRNAANT